MLEGALYPLFSFGEFLFTSHSPMAHKSRLKVESVGGGMILGEPPSLQDPLTLAGSFLGRTPWAVTSQVCHRFLHLLKEFKDLGGRQGAAGHLSYMFPVTTGVHQTGCIARLIHIPVSPSKWTQSCNIRQYLSWSPLPVISWSIYSH